VLLQTRHAPCIVDASELQKRVRVHPTNMKKKKNKNYLLFQMCVCAVHATHMHVVHGISRDFTLSTIFGIRQYNTFSFNLKSHYSN
jgi:hypothetical protein